MVLAVTSARRYIPYSGSAIAVSIPRNITRPLLPGLPVQESLLAT